MTDAPLTLTDLGLTAKTSDDALTRDDSAGCGGGCNCTCGAYDPADEVGAAEDTVTDESVAPIAVTGPVTVDYGVLGMTCAHCVSSVSEEMFDIEGVQNVAIALNVGGVSTVTVTSAVPLESSAVVAAVTEAGYELAGASA